MTEFREGDLVIASSTLHDAPRKTAMPRIGIFLRTSTMTPTGNVAEVYIGGEVDVYHKDWLELVQKAGSSGII